MSSKKVIVIGAGLGGLSAAISLKQSGYDVEMFEKNDKIGGKLNVLKQQGYTFDLGPSILTLPHIFERLFERSGKKMKDYIPIRALRPHWRNFFEDGVTLDLYPEPDKMAAEARKVGEPPENIERFLKYSADLYDLTNDGYFEQGLDNWQGFAKHYGLFKFFQFDLFRTMHQGVASHLQTRYFRDIFDFFIKYVGSSAYRAPAFMNAMPTIQFRYDLWYVDGGLYHIALGLKRLMDELGIKVNLNAEVSEVRRENGRVTGLVANGTFHAADIIVSNMEVIPAYEKLLSEDKAFIASLEKKLEPTCSGLVIELGLDCQYPQLAHHNFFFSGHQKEHFAKVFERYELPDDPTIYLVAASKTDPTVAPAGCDCLKILPHIPHIRDDAPADARRLCQAQGAHPGQAGADGLERFAEARRLRALLDAARHPRAIQLQQRLDLRRRQRPLEEPRVQSAQAKHALPEPLLRRRLGESRRRHADGGALRPERRQEGRRLGQVINPPSAGRFAG